MAALAARVAAEQRVQTQLSKSEQRDILLATANDALARKRRDRPKVCANWRC